MRVGAAQPGLVERGGVGWLGEGFELGFGETSLFSRGIVVVRLEKHMGQNVGSI